MDKRLLGVDWGTRRIGLAISVPGSDLASPLRVLASTKNVDEAIRHILEVATDYDAEAIVVGWPLNMDGTAGPQAKLTEKAVTAMKAHTTLPIYLHDERLTSHAADGRIIDLELTRKGKKARQDALAAQILLESFIQHQKENPPSA